MTIPVEPTWDEVPAEPVNLPREPVVLTPLRSQAVVSTELEEAMEVTDALVYDPSDSVERSVAYWRARVDALAAESALWQELMAILDVAEDCPPWMYRAVVMAGAESVREHREARQDLAELETVGGDGT